MHHAPADAVPRTAGEVVVKLPFVIMRRSRYEAELEEFGRKLQQIKSLKDARITALEDALNAVAQALKDKRSKQYIEKLLADLNRRFVQEHYGHRAATRRA